MCDARERFAEHGLTSHYFDPDAGPPPYSAIQLAEFAARYPAIANLHAAWKRFTGMPFMARPYRPGPPRQREWGEMQAWCKVNRGKHEWNQLWNFAATASGKDPAGNGVYAFLFSHRDFARRFGAVGHEAEQQDRLLGHGSASGRGRAMNAAKRLEAVLRNARASMRHVVDVTRLDEADFTEMCRYCSDALGPRLSEKHPDAVWRAVEDTDRRRVYRDHFKATFYFRERKAAAGFRFIWHNHNNIVALYEEQGRRSCPDAAPAELSNST